VDRVLKHGGYFITQQVGGKNFNEFAEMLNENFVLESPTHTLENYTNTLQHLGFKILQTDESKYSVKFYDVAALVFYAKVIVWEFPKFSVKTQFDKLLSCQQEIDKKGYLEGTGHRFIIVAQKI
jgi:hypothetical protein